MNLYHVSQKQNCSYETFSDFVTCSPDEETARTTNPSNGNTMTDEDWAYKYSSWCNGSEHVTVRLIGVAAESVEPGIICASFHAG